MKIVGGPSSLGLAEKISKSLEVPLVKLKTKRFPDGEFYLKFEEEVSEEELLIVQSLYPPQDNHLIELFLMLHTARDNNAKTIKVFIPYLAYSRQDEIYLKGECLSSGMLADILSQLGTEALYTVDIHNEKVLSMYNIPCYNLSVAGELARYFISKNLKNPFVVSPDDEPIAIERARFAAKTISADYDFFKKSRDQYTGDITTYSKKIDAKNRDAIIIDDIISTGKTAANAAKMLKKQGAQRVFVGVSHALLLGEASEILASAGVEEIVGSDSVLNKYSKVSVAPTFTRAFKENTNVLLER